MAIAGVAAAAGADDELPLIAGATAGAATGRHARPTNPWRRPWPAVQVVDDRQGVQRRNDAVAVDVVGRFGLLGVAASGCVPNWFRSLMIARASSGEIDAVVVDVQRNISWTTCRRTSLKST